MYKLIETKKTNSIFTLYFNDVLVKDTFNLEVIKGILGRKFKKVYENRIVLTVK